MGAPRAAAPPSAAAAASDDYSDDNDGWPTNDETCAICTETLGSEGGTRDWRRADAYETLPGCRHSYCVGCIARWRQQHENNPLGMPCPECRRHSITF